MTIPPDFPVDFPSYGVELECGLERERAVSVLCGVFQSTLTATRLAVGGYKTYTLANGWQIGFDPSLKADGLPPGQCVEITSPILTPHTHTDWAGLLDALKTAGASITPRCGLHVHVEAAGWTPARLVRLCRRVQFQKWGITRERARFIRPIPQTVLCLDAPTETKLKAAWFAGYRQGVPPNGKGRLHPARHRVVNLGSVWYRGTVEFRMFGATLDADTLRARFAQVERMWKTAE